MHYMQREELGVRVWHVANVGTGELITWDIIQRHHHGKKVVDPCVPLVHVPAAVDPARSGSEGASVPSNEFVGKIHRSHRNVKAKKKARALRREEKMLTREYNYQQQVKDFSKRVDQIKSLLCQWCSEPMHNAAALQRHQLNGCIRVRGKTKKKMFEIRFNADPEHASTLQQTDVNNVENTSTVLADTQTTLTKGYAWMALRAHVTETIGPRALLLLEQAFQRGVAKGGDRKSCFQMVSMTA